MARWLHRPELTLVSLIALCALLRLHLIFVYEINWDEFLNLSMVHDFSRGDLKEPLQTIFVQAFRWLPGVSVNEVNQIVAARVVIYLMGIGTMGLIYLISRRFMSVTAALFAVLFYISFSFVIRQGMSFRTDPIATFLLMGAICVLIFHPGRLAFATLAGFLIGLAGLVTIKSVFYIPVIGAILLTQIYYAENRAHLFTCAVVAVVAALAGFGILYILHITTLPDPASALAFLDRTTSKTLGERDFSAAKSAFILSLIYNPLFWIAAATGLLGSIKSIWNEKGLLRHNALIVASFALILSSLFIYTESYVYYYTFLLAPVAVLCGIAFTHLSGTTGRTVTLLAALLLSFSFLSQYVNALQRTNEDQHQLVDVVHKAFAGPVPYIDRTSMISSYPKKSIFMSKWGMADYYAKGEGIMRPILKAEQPPLLIANRRLLELDQLKQDEYGPDHFGLFKDDRDVLQENYVRHWGAIFVAGKRLQLTEEARYENFEILIAAKYQLVANHEAVINGQLVKPGGTITLAQGRHSIIATEPGEYVLRWGHNLYKPSTPAPTSSVFTDF
jgi:hypothetical protein